MKNTVRVVIVMVLMSNVLSFAKAQENKDAQGGTMGGQGMMGKGGMTGMGNMCGMMMSGMMGKTMVPVDGGVVVMVGNKLFKYDKNLKLTNEVDLKIDMQEMRKMMQDMMEQCPMKEQSPGGK